MKQLTIVRHAKSDWSTGLTDFQRPLNRRGKKAAPEMGKRLAAAGYVPDLILSSPAERTRSTAAAVTAALGLDPSMILFDDRLYGAGVGLFLEVLAEIDPTVVHTMLVGHNPGITDLANYLGDRPIQNVPTAGVVHIEMEVRGWRDLTQSCGPTVMFDYPKRPPADDR